MQIEIAPLAEADIDQLDRILRQHVWDRYTKQILEGEITSIKGYMKGESNEYGRTRKYLVAKTQDGCILGCMAYANLDPDMVTHFNDIDPNESAELLNAFVDGQVFRGGGVGRKLFEGICNAARMEGKKYLTIHSGPRYQASWGFYDKMCGQGKGFIVGKYGKVDDAKTWMKLL